MVVPGRTSFDRVSKSIVHVIYDTNEDNMEERVSYGRDCWRPWPSASRVDVTFLV